MSEGREAEFVEVTVEELRAKVGRGAKKRMGLSGVEEFAGLYHAYELPDTLAANELAILFGCTTGRDGGIGAHKHRKWEAPAVEEFRIDERGWERPIDSLT